MVIPLYTEEDRIPIADAARKHLIYLDSNVWISLVEDKEFQNVISHCRQVVSSGKALFPVSNPAVSEVFEQPDAIQRQNVATLMDELSQGLCFFHTNTIHLLEKLWALRALLGYTPDVSPRQETLTWVREFLGPEWIEFTSEWSQADAEKFVRYNAQLPLNRSVRWLAQHLPVKDMRNQHDIFKQRYVSNMGALISQNSQRIQLLDKNLRRKRILFEERCAAIVRALPDIQNLDEKLVGRIMASMPSVDLSCQIFTSWLIDSTTPVEKQDFHDFEHALSGAVYADAFVTCDGYLYQLLQSHCTVSKEQKCNIIKGVDGLANLLASL